MTIIQKVSQRQLHEAGAVQYATLGLTLKLREKASKGWLQSALGAQCSWYSSIHLGAAVVLEPAMGTT